MSRSARERIREELEQFMVEHLPNYDLSELDDVVVEFVAGMVCSDESDIDQLIEVLNAYIPQFGEIETTSVNKWAVQLLDMLQGSDKNEETAADCTCKDTKLSNSLDIADKPDDKENEPRDSNPLPDQRDLDKLSDMFPKASLDHVTKCLKQANGHVNTAVELLLMDCQSSQSKRKTDDQDMTQIKDLIVSRYSYVETTTNSTSYKPHLPQAVPGDKSYSKLRYRDNQVVNTKGERYTVITKKEQEGEHMKHTYINLKPARKYRFH